MIVPLIALAFLATIPAANLLIQHVGAFCVPDGPCLVPIWPGIMAPSGVLMIGLALVLRDWLHEISGRAVVLGCVVAGAALSWLIAPAALALASGVAFLVAELADFAVYDRLRRRGRHTAVLASGLVGAAVDSALFLWLAFGSLDFMAGQVLGKVYASVAVAVVLVMRRQMRTGAG